MLKQISVFARNQLGAMQKITEVLAKENINILGSVTNDSAEYGIVRMIVSDPEAASKALTDAGYLCSLSRVIGVEVEDKPGMLNRLLVDLASSNINVDYIYLSFNRETGHPIQIFKTEDVDEVEACLTSMGYLLYSSSSF